MESFNQSEELGKDLMKILKNGSKNDVTIVCKDGELKANRDILVARSEYFATMLGNKGFVEGQTERIEMKEVEMVCMNVALEYFFSGKINVDVEKTETSTNLYTLDLLRLLLLTKPFNYLEKAVLKHVGYTWGNSDMTEDFCGTFLEDLRLSNTLKLDTISDTLTFCTCMSLDLINDVPQALSKLPLDLIINIMKHRAASPLEKIKTFNLWFSANEDRLSDQEKVEMLKVFQEIATKTIYRTN